MSGKEGKKLKAKFVFLPVCFHGSIDRNESERSGYELLDKKEVLFPLKKNTECGCRQSTPRAFLLCGWLCN